jgi:membrane protein implicated in regulation of membrane protease activity
MTMFDWLLSHFDSATAKIVFLSVFGVGTVYTLASILLGGDHEGHDVDAHADVHADAHIEGPSFFGLRGIMLFCVGFGAAGYITFLYTEKLLVSAVAGLVGGASLMVPGVMIIRFFFRSQFSATLTEQDFAGAQGNVVTSIPSGGLGEVTVQVKDRALTRPARTEDSAPLRTGASVVVVNNRGNVLTVRPSA